MTPIRRLRVLLDVPTDEVGQVDELPGLLDGERNVAAVAPDGTARADEVLGRAAALLGEAGNSFDRARPGQPVIDDELRSMLREPLPDAPEPVTQALEEAALILDESIAQPRPRYFAFVGSSGLPIGVVTAIATESGDVVASCRHANTDRIRRLCL